MISRCHIEGLKDCSHQFAYRGNQPADVTKHHVCTNRCSSCRIANDVGANLSIAKSAEAESSDGNEESGSVSRRMVFNVGREEHDVAYHDEWSRSNEEYCASVKLGAQEWEQNCKDSADDVWRNSMELNEEGIMSAAEWKRGVVAE